jgi:hypothetical protein
MTVFNSFADLAQARINLADAREGITESYDGAFLEHSDLAKLNIIDEPIAAEMPDPDMARRAVEMAIGTIFDVLKDTRMEEFAQQLAWGMVNSFHMTARLAEGREDDAAKKLGEMARHFDPSEIYAVELEETQQLCQTLQGCREALEAMRDHRITSPWKWRHLKSVIVPSVQSPPSMLKLHDFCNRAPVPAFMSG